MVPLVKLGTLLSGQSPPTATVNSDANGTLYVSGPEQWDGHEIHADKWTTEPKRIAPKSSIFITVKGAGVGKIFPGIEAAIGRDIYAFVPQPSMSVRYVEHALRHSVQEVLRHAVGDIPGLSRKHILDHEIPVPPLKVQENIVAEIDKQFSRLDEALANLKRVKANLKRYKAAVLKAAVEGRLVPTESELARRDGRRYEAGAEFLQRILEVRRSQLNGSGKCQETVQADVSRLPTLPDGWCWARLNAIAAIKGGITVDRKRQDPGARLVPYLRVANVQRGYLELADVKKIEASEAEIEDLRLMPGDVLFNEGGDRDKLGRGWIWEGQLSECIHQNHVFRARPFSRQLSAKFISWCGNTLGKEYFLREGKQTTNLASINMTKLAAFPVPIPPAAEQARICNEAERRLSLLAGLELETERSLEHSLSLRQAVLARAFGRGSA